MLNFKILITLDKFYWIVKSESVLLHFTQDTRDQVVRLACWADEFVLTIYLTFLYFRRFLRECNDNWDEFFFFLRFYHCNSYCFLFISELLSIITFYEHRKSRDHIDCRIMLIISSSLFIFCWYVCVIWLTKLNFFSFNFQ